MSNGAQIDGQTIGEYLKFERNAIPILIQVVFWGGLLWVGKNAYYMIKNRYGADEQIFWAIVYFVAMAAAIRIFCEIAVLVMGGNRVTSAAGAPSAPQAAVGTFQMNQPAAAPQAPPQPTAPAVNAQPSAPVASPHEPAPAAGTTVVFCTSCGKQGEVGKKFCTGCGAEMPQ